MPVNIQKDATKISFAISSEIFSFNKMIESCRAFLFNLGYTEMSSMYIVLRELIFNTILNTTNNENTCKFECDIEYIGDDRFTVSLRKIECCGTKKCFGWVKRNRELTDMDRGNTLIHSNTDSIDIDDEYNRITTYMTLQKSSTVCASPVEEQHTQ